MVFLINGCTKNIGKEDGYFVNSDFKNIVDRIIYLDTLSNRLIINLDKEGSSIKLDVFAFDYLEDCNNVVAIFEYKQKIIIMVNNSDYDINNLINSEKIKLLNHCEEYIKKFIDDDYTEYKAFSFYIRSKSFLYLDNSAIEYKNDTIVLEKY